MPPRGLKSQRKFALCIQTLMLKNMLDTLYSNVVQYHECWIGCLAFIRSRVAAVVLWVPFMRFPSDMVMMFVMGDASGYGPVSEKRD